MARTHRLPKSTTQAAEALGAALSAASPEAQQSFVNAFAAAEAHTVREADELIVQPPSFAPLRFDPIEFVRSRITHDEARKSIFRSLSWYLDIAIINEVRSLFFKIYESLSAEGSVDSYNDYLAAMNAAEARETNLVEQGFMRGAGVGAIRDMALLRDDWHDACYDLNPRHEKPTIAHMIRSEKAQLPDTLTISKLKLLADDLAEGDEAEAAELLEAFKQRETALATQRFETAQARVPAIIGMLSFIENTGVKTSADFCDLPTGTRQRLITGLRKVIGDAMVQLATNRKINVLEFAAARKELKAAINEVDALLLTRLCDDEGCDPMIDSSDTTAGRDWQANSEIKSTMRQDIAAARKH